MEDKAIETAVEIRSFIDRHSLFVFITVSICISAVIVFISMEMYNTSGTAQLDLSRPGYVSVRSRVNNADDDLQTYSSSGPINKGVINDFKALFDKQAKEIEAANAFGGSPLDPTALDIGDTYQQ